MSGFTLMELLVTVTIIGILAALVLGAVQAARESGRVVNTRALIAKIEPFVRERYESYRSRRIPLSQAQIMQIAAERGWPLPGQLPPTATPYQRQFAALTIPRIKLNAIRDLMRMEMPDRWSDVWDGPVFLRLYGPNPDVWLVDPALRQRFQAAYNSSSAPLAERNRWGSAECLYQIVMSCPGAKDQFRDKDIGDIDGDGLREFHDGWGHPIRFLRWPVGFVDHLNLVAHNSPDPANPVPPAGREQGPTLSWSPPSDRQSGDPEIQPDSFDLARVVPRLVDLWLETSANGVNPPLGIPPIGRAYSVYPLVYSAGPDGHYDINHGWQETSTGLISFPYKPSPEGDLNPFYPDLNRRGDASGYDRRYIGQPLDIGPPLDDDAPLLNESANDSLDHYDNIHNHRIEAE